MAPPKKLKPFEVVRTPKLRDNEGTYVKRGDIAMLDKETAEKYHGLGLIRVSMDSLFDDKAEADDTPDGAYRRTAKAQGDDGRKHVQSDDAADGDDAAEAGEDAETDAGAGEAEAGTGPSANRRRKRAVS